jgi:Uma2 family endonuclease
LAKLAAFPEPMNVERFLSFVATRPEGEKWELLDGELFLNARPVHPHQIVVANLIRIIGGKLALSGNGHRALPGIGVPISEISAVEPDVMIRKRDNLRGAVCDDIVVAFEVLSPTTRRNDLEFKRTGYARLVTLTDYVVVAPDKVDVLVFSRATNWNENQLTRLDDTLAFDALGISLKLADVYEDMADLLEPGQA